VLLHQNADGDVHGAGQYSVATGFLRGLGKSAASRVTRRAPGPAPLDDGRTR
jgi:hypothetical protein